MATKNSINSNIPIEISKGGTNASSMSVSYGVTYYDTSKVVTVSSVGTSGQVLTSNGSGGAPTFQSASSSISSAFYGYRTGDDANQTGDGTVYTVVYQAERFDIGSDFNTSTGIFTAPSTAKYYLSGCPILYFSSGFSASEYLTELVTSNRTYTIIGNPNASNGESRPAGRWGKPSVALADMDSSDTAYVTVTVSGAGSKVVGLRANDDGARTIFTGWLVG